MTKRTNKQYPNDFKQEAVALVTQQGYSVVEAAASLNINDRLLSPIEYENAFRNVSGWT
ncbi:MAG: transposase [Congregibacter sp.]|jgi:transposase